MRQDRCPSVFIFFRMVLWFDAGRHPGCTAPVTRLKTRGKASRSDATHRTLCALRRWKVSLGHLPKLPRTCTVCSRPTDLDENICPCLLTQVFVLSAARMQTTFPRHFSRLISSNWRWCTAVWRFQAVLLSKALVGTTSVCAAVPWTITADTTRESDQRDDEETGVTDGSGEGFNTLAGYLFGDNKQELAMDMTTPVNIDVTSTGRCVA